MVVVIDGKLMPTRDTSKGIHDTMVGVGDLLEIALVVAAIDRSGGSR